MNILITGANGLLGSEIISQLKDTEHIVYTLSRNTEAVKTFFDNYDNIYSIDDWEKGLLPFDKIDVVIHCAFARANKGGKAIAESLLFTTVLFDYLVKHTFANIINISTQEVYGIEKDIWKETNIVNPNTIYGVSKYFSEMYLQNKAIVTQVKFTNIRLAGLLNIDTNYRMVNKLIEQAIEQKSIKIIKSKILLSQLDTRDAAAGIIALLNILSNNWKQVYNLGYLQSYTLEEIAETIKSVGADYDIKIEIEKEPSDTEIISELDSSLFYKDTNWKPQYNMESIIRNIYEYKLGR